MNKSVRSLVFGLLTLGAASIAASGFFQEFPSKSGSEISLSETAFVVHTCCDHGVVVDGDCCQYNPSSFPTNIMVLPCLSGDRGILPCGSK